jgi:hypothetical protein
VLLGRANSGMLTSGCGHAFEERHMAALEISPIKIGYVIVKAREVAAKVAAWDDGATSNPSATTRRGPSSKASFRT